MSEPERPHILVVDDNADNADIMREYLEARGYPITVAHNGDEALALFENQPRVAQKLRTLSEVGQRSR